MTGDGTHLDFKGGALSVFKYTQAINTINTIVLSTTDMSLLILALRNQIFSDRQNTQSPKEGTHESQSKQATETQQGKPEDVGPCQIWPVTDA